MPELNIDRTYSDGEALLEADLDNIKNAVTTLNNTTKYDGDNLQSEVITAAKIIDGTVATSQLGAGSITTNKLNDSAITTAKIADGEIETRVIADAAVTTAKIADSNITTAKFNTDNPISSSKIIGKSVFVGSNSSTTTMNYGDSETTVVSVTATADTRYCLIMLQPYSSSASGVFLKFSTGTVTSASYLASITLTFKKNGVTLATRSMSLDSTNDNPGVETPQGLLSAPLSAFNLLYTAGTIANGDVISVTASQSHTNSSGEATVSACKLYVIEL